MIYLIMFPSIKSKPNLALILCTCAFMVIAACGGSSQVKKPRSRLETKRPVKAMHKRGSASIVKSLEAQHALWKGVKYRMGGLSKKGVDCSGFVYLTFKSRFKMNIPRTTELLQRYGMSIKRSELRPGDLVFFKSKRKVRHVGIYYKDGKFLHASTSRGVMISSLDNVYWKKHYWQSRRVRIS
jgi:cell wall-associated NlpC family hydrolase